MKQSSNFFVSFFLLLVWSSLDENTNEPWGVNEGEEPSYSTVPVSSSPRPWRFNSAHVSAATNVQPGYFIYRNDPFGTTRFLFLI